MDSKKILIVHPEGNIYNNPNLYEIIKTLSAEYFVEVLVPKLSLNEHKSFESSYVKVIEFNPIFDEHNLCTSSEYMRLFCDYYVADHYDMILGVDRLGLILSNLIARIYHIPYAFISYEIIFEDETSLLYKSIEISAAKDAVFIIVQDAQRAVQLSQENRIEIDKMFLVPVASSHICRYKKNYLLHERFDLPKTTKILLYIGSISSWSCCKEIVDLAKKLSREWVIVFHDRYGDTRKKVHECFGEKKDIPKNIYFSDMRIDTTYDMHKIIHSADIGLAPYCPDYQHILTGKNLKYIGLASGKLSTYLQNGLPVITTKNPALSELLKHYKAGFEVEDIKEAANLLSDFEVGVLNENCIEMFQTVLSFENFKDGFLEKVKHALKQSCRKDIPFKKLADHIEDFIEKNSNFFQSKKNYEFSVDFNRFYETVDRFKKTGLQYLIYGAGTVGKAIESLMPENVSGFIDISNKRDHFYMLQTIKYDKIIISVLGREDEIERYLVNDVGVEKSKIVRFIL